MRNIVESFEKVMECEELQKTLGQIKWRAKSGNLKSHLMECEEMQNSFNQI